ncbi:molybdopterin-guanine dinucleotide biosynthesis protein B, partial [Pantoea sp. SM3]
MADLLDGYVIALASDEKLAIDRPLLDINHPFSVADFIEN